MRLSRSLITKTYFYLLFYLWALFFYTNTQPVMNTVEIGTNNSIPPDHQNWMQIIFILARGFAPVPQCDRQDWNRARQEATSGTGSDILLPWWWEYSEEGEKKDRAPESISHLLTSQGWLFIISILYNICDKQQFISVFFILPTHTALISLYAQLKCHHHLLKTFLISSPK